MEWKGREGRGGEGRGEESFVRDLRTEMAGEGGGGTQLTAERGRGENEVASKLRQSRRKKPDSGKKMLRLPSR